MTQYVVTKNFQDRLTRKYYSIGSIYETSDDQRAFDLELGGYIAPVNTEMASLAKAEAEANKVDQANAQKVAEANQQAKQNAEAKTVVNGKVVSLKAAQMAEAQFNAKNTQTGVQNYHNNTTEAVQAGQVAQQQTQAQARTQATNQQSQQQAVQAGRIVNAHDVQSGQAEVLKEAEMAEQQLQQRQQAAQQAQQQGGSPTASGAEASSAQMYNQGGYSMADYNQEAQNKGTAQTSQQMNQNAKAQAVRTEMNEGNAMAAEHEEAAKLQEEAQNIKAKGARAKKD